MQSIHPVILSGGMGSRLWPLSRLHQPKQFQPVDGADGPSFLQATALRHRGDIFEEPVIVANRRQTKIIQSQLGEIGCTPQIISEPVGRNTGPAVLAAALRLLCDDRDALMAVLPSDHVIDGDLNELMGRMRVGANNGHLVTFGILPRYPETGFGYITNGTPIECCPGLHTVASFVEKPKRELAESLIADGRSFWAAGISLMRADVIAAEFERLEPDTYEAVRRAVEEGETTKTGIVLAEEHFAGALDEPTERAVFEKSRAVAVAPTAVSWNDVGAWSAFHTLGEKCDAGNVVGREVLTVNTSNSFVRGCGKLIAVVGMDGVIVVDTPDALLVTNHQNAQLVKEAVSRLRADGRAEVERHMTPARDAQGVATEVGRLVLKPGAVGELRGAEAAGSVVTVSRGTATIMIGGKPVEAHSGEIFLVRPGTTARVHSDGPDDLCLVAVDITPETKARGAGAPKESAESRSPEQSRSQHVA
jgi:mannose-1-phosphate guanylyltransferase/mannose-6-phosphate isomerase